MSDRELMWVEVSETQIRCCRSLKIRVVFGVIGLIIGAACLYPLVFHWPAPGTLAGRSPADVLGILGPKLSLALLVLCCPTAPCLY